MFPMTIFFFSESKCRFAQACLHGNAIILKFYFFYLKVKFWSQQISFLLIGIIIVTSIRGLLITLTRVRMYKQTFTLCTQASLICVSAFIHVYACPLIKPLLIYLSPLYSFQTFTHLSVYLSSLHSSFCPRLHSSVYSPSFLYISIHPTFTHFSIHPVFTHLYIQSAFILCLFDIHSPVCSPSLNSLRSVT